MPTAPLSWGRNQSPPRQLRLLAAAVALAPSGAVEVQHDVPSSADGGDEQMFGAK
jgi:hypothetical protein